MIDREYVLVERPVGLEGVNATAIRRRYISEGLNGFQQRLENHNGGYFLDEETLRKNDDRRFQDVLTGSIAELHWFRPDEKRRPTYEYVSSGRANCNGPVFQCGGPTECPVTLYVDGQMRFTGAFEKDPSNYPDLNGLKTQDYAGVEFYPGGASIPLQFNASANNNCGVLLLWSRER